MVARPGPILSMAACPQPYAQRLHGASPKRRPSSVLTILGNAPITVIMAVTVVRPECIYYTAVYQWRNVNIGKEIVVPLRKKCLHAVFCAI